MTVPAATFILCSIKSRVICAKNETGIKFSLTITPLSLVLFPS